MFLEKIMQYVLRCAMKVSRCIRRIRAIQDIITQVLMLLGGIGALVLAFKLLSDNIEKLANSGLKKMFNKTGDYSMW